MAVILPSAKPCKRGHISGRYASNGNCVDCARMHAAVRAKADPQRRKALHAEWRKRNPEKLRAWAKIFRDASPARQREYQRKWEKANAPKIAAYRAGYRKANREKVRGLCRDWRKENPDYLLAASAGRRALKSAAPGRGVSIDEWRIIKDGSLGLCAYCIERRPLAMEHIDPIIRGGAHDPENVTTACKQCNTSKRDTPLLIWLARLALRRHIEEEEKAG